MDINCGLKKDVSFSKTIVVKKNVEKKEQCKKRVQRRDKKIGDNVQIIHNVFKS